MLSMPAMPAMCVCPQPTDMTSDSHLNNSIKGAENYFIEEMMEMMAKCIGDEDTSRRCWIT